MYSPENCRARMLECRELLSSAQSDAESTVLKLLVRNWRAIANQTDRYTELVRSRPSKK